MVLAGGTGALVVPELCVCPMCHSCPEPVWFQRSHCGLAAVSHAVGYGCAGAGALGFTCPSTGQRESTCPSILLLPGLAARALQEESEAVQVLLVYFAGDDNFLPAAHSLINRSEDVGREA